MLSAESVSHTTSQRFTANLRLFVRDLNFNRYCPKGWQSIADALV